MPKNSQSQERRALSVLEAAWTCGISRATVYRLIAEGRLATLKIGARRLIPVGAIDALLDATKAHASGEDEERGSISKPPRRAARLAHAEVSAK
jgi:excisionase family DNA binding protein